MSGRRGAGLTLAVLLAGCGPNANEHQLQATQAELDEIRSQRTMVAVAPNDRAEQVAPLASAAPRPPAPPVPSAAPAAPVAAAADAAPAADWAGEWTGAPGLCGKRAWRLAGSDGEGGGRAACEIRSAAAGAPGTVTFKLACAAPGMTANERWSLRRMSADRMELGRDAGGRTIRETLGRCA